ncbi:MAG: LysR family transcriptional regulator [Gammaproteobacteria bacterium]|nr:LysR family transcriptional regulator [Gammaproteobacteria bacterium]
MNVTIRQLKVFAAVAKHNSFTRAAEALHLTQPAVSMQVKQLEGSAGLPLFEQIGKKIFLTEAGREMYHYARQIAQQLNEAEEVMQALKGIQRGRLAISVASTANHFGTRLLAAFSKKYPSVTIKLDVVNRETLLHQLVENEKDLVIMGQPPSNIELNTEPFMENPLVMVAHAGHPWAKEKNIKAERLRDKTFVVREPGSGTRMAMERFFESHGIPFEPGMEMTSNEAIKQAVEAGLGLAVVSIHTLELELETGRLAILNVQGFPIMRHWYVVHPRSKRLSPVAETFRQFVLNEAQSGFQAAPSLTGD